MEENIRGNIQKLNILYQNLGKEKLRNTDKVYVKRRNWKGHLIELLKISHQNLMNMIRISQENK